MAGPEGFEALPARRRRRRARRGRDRHPALARRPAARTHRARRRSRPRSEDPLAALFAEGPSEPPADPALARLFPEAYASEESEELRAKSAEFRRFTENDLRARKRADALAVVRGLDALSPRGDGGAVLKLTAEDARHWLGALNDLRLTIATRLDITDEDESGELYRLPDDDPRKPMVMAYLWLGVLQETLIDTLMP